MKLKVVNNNTRQTLTLDLEDAKNLWVSLSIEGEYTPSKYNDKTLQDVFDVEFNRPDYNNFHKMDRHRGYSQKVFYDDFKEGDDVNEPEITEVKDPSVFFKYQIEHEREQEYQCVCEFIRQHLKPENADLFIAIAIDGISQVDYAARLGVSPNNISKRYNRAKKKLAKVLEKASFLSRVRG